MSIEFILLISFGVLVIIGIGYFGRDAKQVATPVAQPCTPENPCS